MPSPVSQALAALALTRPDYDLAQQHYEGTTAEVMVSTRLRELLDDPNGEAYRVNYARTPVDVMVERTEIQGWTAVEKAVVAALELVWADNELGIEAKDVHRRAYEYGDSYLIGWRDDELPGKVSVYAHDPTSVRVFYDPARPRRKSLAVHTWEEPGDEANGLPEGWWQRVNLYYPDHVERYVSKTESRDQNGMARFSVTLSDDEWDDFVADGDDAIIFYADQGLPDVIPVFHFRTARPYGRPEHRDAYGPQNGINKLYASLMANVDFTIAPQRYLLTDSALSGREAPALFDEDEATTDAGGFSADSEMESGPGATWLISGKNVRAGQFSAADAQNFLLPKNDLVDAMAAVTDMPIGRFRRGNVAPSGESYRMEDVPLNKKTSDRFAQFGVTWHEFAEWVLAVQAGGDVKPTDVQVSWAPPETYTDKDSWEAATWQLKAGVPYDQVLRERGYSSDLVDGWVKAREARGLADPAADPSAPVAVEDVPAA